MKRLTQFLLISLTTTSLLGCVSTASITKDAYGSKEGELPLLTRSDFNAMKPLFLTKVTDFRNTGNLPFDVTGFEVCSLSKNDIQQVSGFTSLVEIANKMNNPEAQNESKSLAERVNSSAAQQSSTQTKTTYTWGDGSVIAKPEDCSQLLSEQPPARYLVKYSYSTLVEAETNVSGKVYESTSESSVHNVIGMERKVKGTFTTSASSVEFGGSMHDGLISSLVINLNDMQDPTFTYSFSDEQGRVSFMDVASTQGIYMTSESVNLSGNRTRTTTYSGKEIAMISRSKDGKPHGEMITINKQYGDTTMCFENGAIVQTSTCEKF